MKKDISQITTYDSGIMQSTAHRILTRIKSEYLSQYDITTTQWFAIGLAYEAGEQGIRLGDLMRKLDTTMPFITNLVNILESKSILHKVNSSEDSRIKIAILNPAFASQVEQIENGLREELRIRLYNEDHISRDELSTYISVLYKIAQVDK